VAGRNLDATRYCLPGAAAGMAAAGRGGGVAPPKTTLVQVLPPPVDGVNEREISMGANLINNNNNNNDKKKKLHIIHLYASCRHISNTRMHTHTHTHIRVIYYTRTHVVPPYPLQCKFYFFNIDFFSHYFITCSGTEILAYVIVFRLYCMHTTLL